jgi:hypothetical protein
MGATDTTNPAQARRTSSPFPVFPRHGEHSQAIQIAVGIATARRVSSSPENTGLLRSGPEIA